MLVAIDVGHHKRHNSENHGNRNVARYVGTSREEGNQAQQVVDPNKEEDGQQQGDKTLVVRTNVVFRDVVAHKNHQGLNKASQAAGAPFGFFL